jgi:hypothetical protein
MAAEKKRGEGPEPDPIVEALIPDPSAGPPNATVLHGYLGRSATEGYWRLYTSETLDEYVELPEAEILHTRRLPDDGGTLLWVPATLELRYVQTARGVQAAFLGGPISAAGLPPAAATPGALPPPSIPVIRCPSDFSCPSDEFPCTSVPVVSCPRPSVPIIRCPRPTTPAAGCPRPTTPAAGCPFPSEDIPCESFGFRCPTRPIGCPTNVLRCRTNEPACRSEFGCPSDPFCGGLGF